MTALLFAVGLLVFAPALTFAAYWLSKRLGHKKSLVLLAGGGALLAFMGLPVIVLRVVAAYKAVGGDIAPEMKSRMLSAGISEAITQGGLLIAFGLTLALLSILAAAKFQRATVS